MFLDFVFVIYVSNCREDIVIKARKKGIASRQCLLLCNSGRDDRIRTCDLIVPNDARYQTVLHPDKKVLYAYLGKIASKICVFYV